MGAKRRSCGWRVLALALALLSSPLTLAAQEAAKPASPPVVPQLTPSPTAAPSPATTPFPPPRPRVTAAVRAAVAEGVRYDPAVREKALADAAAAQAAADAGEVIALERYVLTESRQSAQLAESIAQQVNGPKERAFQPLTGGELWNGTLLGKPATLSVRPLEDVMAEDARFKSDPGVFHLDILKLKF